MATLKMKEIRNMSKEERNKKLKELKFQLIISKGNSSKKGSSKTKEIKKIIARILSLNKSKSEELKKN